MCRYVDSRRTCWRSIQTLTHNTQPKWCPFSDDTVKIIGVDACEFRCRSHETNGSSAFCIGKTDEFSFDKEGYNHTNGYVFCMRNPQLNAAKTYHICMHAVNKRDMEILHAMIHEAVGKMASQK
jgi:hypothetical protein